jgi:hypothetical protein
MDMTHVTEVRGAGVPLAVLAAALAVLALVAGSCSSGGEECTVGSERCTCTSNGGCDPGLNCASGRCVVIPGGSGGSGGGGGSSGGSSGSQAGTGPGSGGTGGTGGQPAGGGDPKSRCLALAGALCSKAAACTGSATQGCVEAVAGPDQLKCDQVTSVTASHASCLMDVAAASCPLMLPASCKGVHQFSSAPVPPVDPNTPVGKCHAIATALCTKQGTCQGGSGPTTGCVQDAVGRFGCSRVTGVGPTYNTCLADIPRGACPLAVPASCQSVLLFGTAPPASGGGTGSWQCDAYGSYEVCMGDPADFPLCSTKDVNTFGLGPSEADAGLVALKFCNDELAKQIVINNVYWRARTKTDCLVTRCRPN